MEGQTGFKPDGHGFQNYKENDGTSTGFKQGGFQDTSPEDFQNKGFNPDGHGFQNYKGNTGTSTGFQDTSSDDPFKPQPSTGFSQGGFRDTSDEYQNKGYQPQGHGFQNYNGDDSTQTKSGGAYSTGFVDSSENDPFKPSPSTGFDNEPQNKGYNPEGHGFSNYKGDDSTSSGFKQGGFEKVSSGFEQGGFDQVSSGFKQGGFEQVSSGFKQGGFQDTKDDPFKPTPSGAFNNESQNEGFQDTSSDDPFKPKPSTGFSQGGFN